MIEKLEPNFYNPATGTKFYDNSTIVEKLNEVIEELNKQILELKIKDGDRII